MINHAPTPSGIFRFSVVWSMPNFAVLCPSEASDERKTRKMTFRPRTKCKKQQNLRFVHGRNAKNSKIYVSSTDEMQKTAKSTFRPRTKCRKRQNLRFAHGRNAEIGKICVSPTGEMQKNAKNYVSSTGEMQKSAKSTFRPRAKYKKREKLRFAHGRNAKISKINVFATAEAFF